MSVAGPCHRTGGDATGDTGEVSRGEKMSILGPTQSRISPSLLWYTKLKRVNLRAKTSPDFTRSERMAELDHARSFKPQSRFNCLKIDKFTLVYEENKAWVVVGASLRRGHDS